MKTGLGKNLHMMPGEEGDMHPCSPCGYAPEFCLGGVMKYDVAAAAADDDDADALVCLPECYCCVSII